MHSRVSRNWLQRRTFLGLSAIAVVTSFIGIAEAATVDDLQALTFPDGKGHTLPYRLFIPKTYDAAKKFRLVLVFHGAGERGTDNRNQLAGQSAPLVFADDANQTKWPVFLVAPQCPGDQQWVDMAWGEATGVGKLKPVTWPMAAALALLDELAVTYKGIDTSRLYVTGLSMGGYGTWDAIYRAPRKFRKAVAMCGGYDPTTVTSAVGTSGRWFDIPFWDFHSKGDGTVPVGRSIEMLDAIMAKGGTPAPIFTQYGTGNLPEVGHGVWVPGYATPGLLPWMFDNDLDLDGGVTDSGAVGDAGGAKTDAGGANNDAGQMQMGQGGGSQADGAPASGSGGSAGGASNGGAGTTVSGGGGSGNAGNTAAAPASTDDAGCACRAAPTDRTAGRAPAVLAFVLALLGRRRRR
jgi:MYXO-CTERM domain-containing protein